MKVINGKTQEKEKLVKLSDAKPGSVVRFPSVSFEDAISGKDEAQFFMVINKQPVSTGRVALVSLDGVNIIERDADREVAAHEATIALSPNE